MVYSFCSNGTSSRSTRGPSIINVYSSTQGYIAFRLYVIWDQRNPVKLILRTALAITYIPVFIIGGICIVTFYSLSLVFFYPLLLTYMSDWYDLAAMKQDTRYSFPLSIVASWCKRISSSRAALHAWWVFFYPSFLGHICPPISFDQIQCHSVSVISESDW